MPDEQPPVTPTPPRELEGDRFRTFEVWKKYEDIAMHFNDLISKLRFQALAGVAGLSASIVLLADRLSGPGRSPATLAAVAFLALAVLWIALWVLDFLYYNRLLLGAVDEIVRVEKETQFSNKIGRLAFSETVKNAVEAPVFPKRDDNTADKSAELTEEGKKRSMWRKSQRGPRYFYAIVLVSLLLLSFLSYFSGRGQASPPPTGPDKPGPNGGAPPCSPCATPCSPCTTPVPSQQAGQTTSLTPPVPIPEVVQR